VSWVLAVDGGNTKTLAVVAGADGRVRGLGRTGCSDIYNAPSPATALETVERAVAAALAEAGIGADALEAAVFSMAGADWPEDFTLLDRELRRRLALPVVPLVVNDAMGALRTGAPDWVGIAVVSGTFNAVGARRPDGRLFHLGFWPDGAGGRDLGRLGLEAVYRADLGLAPETALTERALELYGADDPIALLHAFTRRGGLQESDQDRLSPAVLDVAEAGDPVAREIVLERGRLLGGQGRVAAERIELPLAGTLVVLTGSVFAHPTELLAGAVMAELPGAEPVRHGPPPIAGAVLLALDRIGIRADPATVGASLTLTPTDEKGGSAWVRSGSTM
jgi:N-acetylglucosamine kinase-like BadF-type ATPase